MKWACSPADEGEVSGDTELKEASLQSETALRKISGWVILPFASVSSSLHEDRISSLQGLEKE